MNTGVLGSENNLPLLLIGSQGSSINDGLTLLMSNLGKFPPTACMFGNMLNLQHFSPIRRETVYVKFGSQV